MVVFDPRHVFFYVASEIELQSPWRFRLEVQKNVVLTPVPLLTQWPRVEIPPASQLAGTAATYELASPSRHANAVVSILSITAQTLMPVGSSAPWFAPTRVAFSCVLTSCWESHWLEKGSSLEDAKTAIVVISLYFHSKWEGTTKSVSLFMSSRMIWNKRVTNFWL